MKWLIKVIFKAVKLLISVILAPIDAVLESLAPEVSGIIAGVVQFFEFLTDVVIWVKSWLPFTDAFWVALAGVLIFKYTIPLATHTIKVIVAWYNKLKP